MKTYMVVKQKWLESERGWGSRPDGYSLHLSVSDCTKYISEYWDKMPDRVPEEHSRPSGDPQSFNVDEETHKNIKQSACGIRCC